MWLHILFCCYSLIILCRFFKAFRAQPRLALVTTTLAHASADLLHLLIVMSAIFISFVFSGIFLLGTHSDDFMNVEFAFNTLFRMMLGDFDFKDISKQHRRSAWIWFVLYMVLITLVMLNMIMAVVLDIYTEVKYWSSGKNIESAWTTTYSILAAPFLRRHWVPESQLVEAFEKAFTESNGKPPKRGS